MPPEKIYIDLCVVILQSVLKMVHQLEITEKHAIIFLERMVSLLTINNLNPQQLDDLYFCIPLSH
jgi:hypothetical protein